MHMRTYPYELGPSLYLSYGSWDETTEWYETLQFAHATL